MKYGFIYITTNLVTGKQYVGQRKFRGKKDNEYLGSGTILNQSIQKHGKENFKREIICECSSKEELDIKETFYIQKFKTLWPIGYNLIEKGGGGDLLKNHPDRLEIIKKLKGKTSWNKGLTKETDERVRNNALQTSISCKGRTFSKETLEKFSKARKGKKLKPHSIETKKKIGLSNSKKVVIEGIIYNSGAAAANALGISTPLLHWRIKAKTFPNYIMAD